MIKGTDVSIHQGTINFDQLKTVTSFVIMKCTEGTGFTDDKFLRNQAEARRTGMLVGYYHFARPDLRNTAEAEADWFLSVVNPKAGEVLCLDYEPPSNPGDVVLWCKTFLDRVFAKTNTRPLIYLNQSQVKGFNWKPVIDGGYGLWLAAYVTTLPLTPWAFVAIQQTSSSGIVAGISGNVDTNIFFGDAIAWKKYGYVGTPSTDYKAKYDALLIENQKSLTKVDNLTKALKAVHDTAESALK